MCTPIKNVNSNYFQFPISRFLQNATVFFQHQCVFISPMKYTRCRVSYSILSFNFYVFLFARRIHVFIFRNPYYIVYSCIRIFFSLLCMEVGSRVGRRLKDIYWSPKNVFFLRIYPSFSIICVFFSLSLCFFFFSFFLRKRKSRFEQTI